MSSFPLNLHHPFTKRQFLEAGGDPRVLRRRAFKQVLRAVWVHRDGIDDDTGLRAALAIHPEGAFASHFSAARLLRLPVPEHAFEHVTVLHPDDRRYRPEIKSHVTTREREPIAVRGIPSTDPITTFIQLAGVLSLLDLVVLGDALVRKCQISPGQLLTACRESREYYVGLACRGAELVREGVGSVMETRLRLLLVLAGLPEPEVNVIVYNEDGTWKRRFDLCYRKIKLIVEYDGRHHAESASQWNSDLERREEFDDEGYRILVVTARGLFVEPGRTIQRVRRQLIVRGWGDVPPVDDAWKTYFTA
ncbi:MAG: hypothetical protein JWO11_3263 [Nocardioides sp.]|nr:hypothetical protein [Nocardioides sp.]